MLAEERFSNVNTGRANPFNSNSGALLKKVEYAGGDAWAAARVRKIYRFSDDVIGR